MTTRTLNLPQPRFLRTLTVDGRLLFLTRMSRMFAYGFLSVVLALYLAQIGLGETQIGLLLTLTLVGDTVISLFLTTRADRFGRRHMLLVGAGLMVFAGAFFAFTKNYIWLVVTATIGVISPSGNEVGPFLSIEQAALAQLLPATQRTRVFAWYNLAGSFSTAFGALSGGGLAQLLQGAGFTHLNSYRAVVMGYAGIGLLLIFLFRRVSNQVEVSSSQSSLTKGKSSRLGLTRSGKAVFKLSALFALDAFAGGFVIQSMIAYWFNLRFGVEPAILGAIFFGANILAGLSALSAAWIATRIGLINTMVFSHLPSNILLILVPFMPSLGLAIAFLLLRFSISQMDVPTRQSYTMAVVDPEERSAAAGITGVARTTGSALAPVFSGILLSSSALIGLPFVISGTLKIIYDVGLFVNFRSLKPPEEMKHEK